MDFLELSSIEGLAPLTMGSCQSMNRENPGFIWVHLRSADKSSFAGIGPGDAEIEIGVRVRFVVQGEVPPFDRVVSETVLFHQ